MTSAAQDEFDALFNSGSNSPSQPHQEDRSDIPSPPSSPGHNEKTIRSHTNPDSDHEDDDEATQPRKSGKMRTRYFVPSSRSEANTGPKGVIADAQAFEQARRAHRNISPRSQKAISQYRPAPVPSHVSSRDKAGHARNGSWLMEADEDSDSEDDFLSRWRQSRLQELSHSHNRPTYMGRRSTSAPRYGAMQTVDAEGYLDAIETARRDATVIVFIYDDLSEVSQLIEHCVHSVARAFPSVRFVKLHYEQAEMDAAGVPAILAYRAADKFADMIPVLDEIPEDDELSAETLAFAMKRKGMLA
ncbi:thioredoxin-like protein [Microthyrium microscopicum]|uniref:Thioredoxin-like protein n=1 Tax=Microthyrium microscopicum TaxID=703497 RepID=A0A6A6TYL4_9PEZI|nr:thioredoxin-like protein [Microthyrium microscopicum]